MSAGFHRTIWRVPVEVTDDQTVTVNEARVRRILSAGFDPRGTLSLWVEVVPTRNWHDSLRVSIRGTGHPTGGNLPPFIGTAIDPVHPLVWHVFAEQVEA
jgi:hypothetical protein